MTGQENVTFKYRWLLNRGGHNDMDRFDYMQILLFLYNCNAQKLCEW
jgi:hypothetical protein